MSIKNLQLLPIVQFVWYSVGFIITYSMSVFSGHLPPVLPYVSETGGLQPESCIFTIILVFGGLQMAIINYIKHRQTQEIIKDNNIKQNLAKWDKISFYTGSIGPFGVSVTGCIPVTASLKVHIFFAGISVMCGLIYAATQTIISFKIYPINGSKIVNIFRAFIAIGTTIASGFMVIFGIISFVLFTGDDIMHWTPNLGGYDSHLVSSISEWIVIMGTVLFLTTYTNDFKNVTFEESPINLKNRI